MKTVNLSQSEKGLQALEGIRTREGKSVLPLLTLAQVYDLYHGFAPASLTQRYYNTDYFLAQALFSCKSM